MGLQGEIRELVEHKGRVCRDILTDLPEWFGIPESLEQYVRDVEHLLMFGLLSDAGQVVGFLSLKMHTPSAAEAYVLGVLRNWHRKGIGRRLFEHAEQVLRKQGITYLTVKTVASTRQNEAYAMTRRFYEAIGFLPLEVFPTLWGEGNPCLLMVKGL
jgi:ribosomal protein S18 acetylase RimI-like enzyme